MLLSPKILRAEGGDKIREWPLVKKKNKTKMRKCHLQEGGGSLSADSVWTRAERYWNEKASVYFKKLLCNDYLLGSLPLSSQQFLPPITWCFLFAAAIWLTSCSLPAHLLPQPAFTVATNPPLLPFADSTFWSKYHLVAHLWSPQNVECIRSHFLFVTSVLHVRMGIRRKDTNCDWGMLSLQRLIAVSQNAHPLVL